MTSGLMQCQRSEKLCLIMILVHGHVKAREMRLAIGMYDINVLFSASAILFPLWLGEWRVCLHEVVLRPQLQPKFVLVYFRQIRSFSDPTRLS